MAIMRGLRGTADLRVGEEDTALALGSGDVPVLATPRVLALAEAATVAATAGQLDEGSTTVGTEVALSHLAASAVGAGVRAEAGLRLVDGKRLVFDVTVAQTGGGELARGTVERVVVDRARFTAAARS
ncbi:thioesterase family protein [Streptomonospora litoralis]|uniref:Fluoroacetyl-CoA thioesterase n=1 Tax=Streptomonospora litoralis TaxID=2498135 RepID=A0A4P6Q1T0_9ACTN|nr:thioesterase [Streptomonospora litoralis]QBI52674.1 Fluoroacetyl-CoA thioesterase [Streptomonospora litoralis]